MRNVDVEKVGVREDRWGNVVVVMWDNAGNRIGEVVLGLVEAERLHIDLFAAIMEQKNRCVLCNRKFGMQGGAATSVEHPGRMQHYPNCAFYQTDL